MKTITAILFMLLSVAALAQNKTTDTVPSLDGKSFEVRFIQVGNADIVTGRKVMSQYAQEARPTEAERQKPSYASTVLKFRQGHFYSGLIPPSQHGCLYKISTSTAGVISFESSCTVYESYFVVTETTYSQNQKQDTSDPEDPVNKPDAAWGGTVKGSSIEGIVSWTSHGGKHVYYYYSGNAVN